jgi:hypothetical protein
MEGSMTRPHDEFRLQHAGKIREVLIELEGEDGGFELLRHGRLADRGEADGALYAVVRSLASGREYMLVEDEHAWRKVADEAFAAGPG